MDQKKDEKISPPLIRSASKLMQTQDSLNQFEVISDMLEYFPFYQSVRATGFEVLPFMCYQMLS